MINADIAYLLGMIVGKGEIIRGNSETRIVIHIPHKNLKIEGENASQSVRSSLLSITQRLRELIGSDLNSETENLNYTTMFFSKPNGDYFIRDINNLLLNKTNWKEFRIPEDIIKNPSIDIKKEFLRGLSDVTGHIRDANSAYGKPYGHRVYIEVMDNYDLVIDLSNLLKSLDIPIQDIRWGHPNFVDPVRRMYNKKNRHYKEHQIKIFAEEFEKVGFNIEHKNQLLKEFSKTNRREWKSLKPIEQSHHKFYWQTKRSPRIKPAHPDEDNSKIHPKIKGKHFNSWKEIAQELGYHE